MRKIAEAYEQQQASSADFYDLRDGTNVTLLVEWDALDDTPRRGPGGIVESVYRMPQVDGRCAQVLFHVVMTEG